MAADAEGPRVARWNVGACFSVVCAAVALCMFVAVFTRISYGNFHKKSGELEDGSGDYRSQDLRTRSFDQLAHCIFADPSIHAQKECLDAHLPQNTNCTFDKESLWCWREVAPGINYIVVFPPAS